MKQLIQKALALKQIPCVIFITGLPSAGKTTIANELGVLLIKDGFLTKILDGDTLRVGLNSDLKFSIADRAENIRRVAEVSRLFIECGIITIVCLVSPTDELRKIARNIIGSLDLIEVYVDCSLEECEKRDVKGMYKKARLGLIKDFTGIQQPFEAPKSPNVIINTEFYSISESVKILLDFILPKICVNDSCMS